MLEKMKEYNKLVARKKKAEIYMSNLNNDVEKYLDAYDVLMKEMYECEKWFEWNGVEFMVEGFEIK